MSFQNVRKEMGEKKRDLALMKSGNYHLSKVTEIWVNSCNLQCFVFPLHDLMNKMTVYLQNPDPLSNHEANIK